MAEVVIQALQDKHIGSFRRALDTIARERRYLLLLEAPPLANVMSFIHEARAGGAVQLVATHGAHVVGWCDIRRKSPTVFPHVGLLGMGVIPERRREGLGRRLLELALSEASSAGMQRVELEVFASNAGAVRLYEQMGFVQEGRKVKACRLDGRFEDILTMAYLDEELSAAT